MRTILLAIVLVAFIAAPCHTMSQSWDNWVLSNWTPDWTYTGGFTIPDTSTIGFVRQKISGPSDPMYIVRYSHYTWISTQVPGLNYVCGPETYLNTSFLCVRHHLYWNVAVVGGSCKPDTVLNGKRNTCESTGATNCCYKSSGGDLVNFGRLASTYPPGS